MRQTFLQRLSRWQQLLIIVATVAPAIIVLTIAARLAGLISTEQMIDTALGAGEDPGVVTFAAMFLASPVQWLTGRSQVRVRKYLGIVFYGLAASNFAMFIVENRLEGGEGLLVEIAGSAFLLAGILALAIATPLFLTSSRWSQRFLGMRRWRLLHRLTYGVAIALALHLLLIPEGGPGLVLLLLGLIARIPAVKRRLAERGSRSKMVGHSQELVEPTPAHR